MIITEPGILDIPSETYHADPAETPSLSSGMINDLLIAPAKCRENSRRLNPDWEERDDDGKFTLGTVSHVLFLEPQLLDQKVIVVKYDDWRTKDAKQARLDAKACGKTAILEKHMEKVLDANHAFLSNAFTSKAFAGGKYEQSMFWRHPTYGFWCRARPDFIPDSRAHLCDYKATADANPANFGRHAYNMGYHRRAAWYLEGAEILFGKRPSHYWFCNQETKAPYLTAVAELDHLALELGREDNERAAALFARCLETNEWPGYRHPNDPDRDMAFQVQLPNWAYMRAEEYA